MMEDYLGYTEGLDHHTQDFHLHQVPPYPVASGKILTGQVHSLHHAGHPHAVLGMIQNLDQQELVPHLLPLLQ